MDKPQSNENQPRAGGTDEDRDAELMIRAMRQRRQILRNARTRGNLPELVVSKATSNAAIAQALTGGTYFDPGSLTKLSGNKLYQYLTRVENSQALDKRVQKVQEFIKEKDANLLPDHYQLKERGANNSDRMDKMLLQLSEEGHNIVVFDPNKVSLPTLLEEEDSSKINFAPTTLEVVEVSKNLEAEGREIVLEAGEFMYDSGKKRFLEGRVAAFKQPWQVTQYDRAIYDVALQLFSQKENFSLFPDIIEAVRDNILSNGSVAGSAARFRKVAAINRKVKANFQIVVQQLSVGPFKVLNYDQVVTESRPCKKIISSLKNGDKNVSPFFFDSVFTVTTAAIATGGHQPFSVNMDSDSGAATSRSNKHDEIVMRKKSETWTTDLLFAEKFLQILSGAQAEADDDFTQLAQAVAQDFLELKHRNADSLAFPFILNVMKRKFEITKKEKVTSSTRNIFVPSNPLQVALGVLISSLYQPDHSALYSTEVDSPAVRSIMGASLFRGGLHAIFASGLFRAARGKTNAFVFSDNIFLFRHELRGTEPVVVYYSIDGEKMEGSMTKEKVKRELARALREALGAKAVYDGSFQTLQVNSSSAIGPGWARFVTNVAPELMVDAPVLVGEATIIQNVGMGSGTSGTGENNDCNSIYAAAHIVQLEADAQVHANTRELTFMKAIPCEGEGRLSEEVESALMKIAGVSLTVERRIVSPQKVEEGKIIPLDFLGMCAAFISLPTFDENEDVVKARLLVPALEYERVTAALAFSKKGRSRKDDSDDDAEKPTKQRSTGAAELIKQEMVRIAKLRSIYFLSQLYPQVMELCVTTILASLSNIENTLKRILRKGKGESIEDSDYGPFVHGQGKEALEMLFQELAEQNLLVETSMDPGATTSELLSYGLSGTVPDEYTVLQVLMGDDVAEASLIDKMYDCDFERGDLAPLEGFIAPPIGGVVSKIFEAEVAERVEDGTLSANGALRSLEAFSKLSIPQHPLELLMQEAKEELALMYETPKVFHGRQAKLKKRMAKAIQAKNVAQKITKGEVKASRAVAKESLSAPPSVVKHHVVRDRLAEKPEQQEKLTPFAKVLLQEVPVYKDSYDVKDFNGVVEMILDNSIKLVKGLVKSPAARMSVRAALKTRGVRVKNMGSAYLSSLGITEGHSGHLSADSKGGILLSG